MPDAAPNKTAATRATLQFREPSFSSLGILEDVHHDKRMTVFISCSGSLSFEIGKLLFSWLPEVNQSVKPWLYSEDIDKGALWPEEVDKALDTTVGILCVTQENKKAPWLLFEAGGLSKRLPKARVCPLLIDLKSQDVKQPLARFNFTLPNKEDMCKLLGTINRADSEKAVDEKVLEKSFDRLWPEFEKPFREIREAHKKEAKPAQRGVEDMVIEILDLIRKMQREKLEAPRFFPPPFGYSGYSGKSGADIYRDTAERLKFEEAVTAAIRGQLSSPEGREPSP